MKKFVRIVAFVVAVLMVCALCGCRETISKSEQMYIELELSNTIQPYVNGFKVTVDCNKYGDVTVTFNMAMSAGKNAQWDKVEEAMRDAVVAASNVVVLWANGNNAPIDNITVCFNDDDGDIHIKLVNGEFKD
ncbi:MAG: hypothetical protein MJZ20_12295 [Bacteroidaceae bacterium]|nr:hypothetical protein [Bacteroidaceae bacterium]